MQSVSTQFQTRAAADLRPISWRFLASFDKEFISGIDFFTIGVSLIGGNDIIRGDGSVVQEWDKYRYIDYSDRVIDVEWSRSEESLYSVAMAIADVTLDNHDNFFTPTESGNVLPGRPMRIYAGFGDENVQVFVGLVERMPEVDEKNKTIKFHCIDFLSSVTNKPLDQELLYQNMRVDEVIDGLLQTAGLSPTQYDLDVAYTTIPFAFFEKGTKIIEALKKLVQSDLGSLYMDESGIIRYRNRQNYPTNPIYSFNGSNVLDFQTSTQDDIINVVEVKADIREVQDTQQIYKLSEPKFLPANSSTELFFNFDDPITAMTSITSFVANTASDGSGSSVTITISDTDLFSKSVKVTFSNTHNYNAYLTQLTIYGTPAKVVSNLYIREQDDDSVDKFGEKVLTIENEYLQDASTALSLALLTLIYKSGYAEIAKMEVKGSPALQIGDAVTAYVPIGKRYANRPIGLLLALTKSSLVTEYKSGQYNILQSENQIASGKYTQKLTVQPKVTVTFFTIGVSLIGGEDVIAP